MLACIWMFVNWFASNLYDDRYCCTLHFDTSLIYHDLDSRSHRSTGKQHLRHTLSHKVFYRFKRNLVYCWDLLVWWTLYTFYLIHSVFKRENAAYMILFKKISFNFGLYSHILKLGRMIETTMLYSLISVWMTLAFIQGHSWEIKNVGVLFLTNLKIWISFATACWFVEANIKFILHK